MDTAFDVGYPSHRTNRSLHYDSGSMAMKLTGFQWSFSVG